MDAFDREQLTERECLELFRRLFPQRLAGADLLAELAPSGWERSPLLAAFHPSIEQVHHEAVQVHHNVEALLRSCGTTSPRPEPHLDEIRCDWDERPIEVERELRELVGRCVWDVFSDNHRVVAPDGRLVDIGSFRGAAGFVADLLNAELGTSRYDYMDFYMGTIDVAGRADLTPVYAAIFGRLARARCDWEYAFPRLHLIELGHRDDTMDFAERMQHERERAEVAETLAASHRQALQQAKQRPPPRTVAAYQQVYGQPPRGWPPWEAWEEG